MRRLISICGLALLAIAPAVQARPGDLDETFSEDGLVESMAQSGHNAVAVQADGAIVVAGGTDGGGAITLARYRPDGTVDTGFGAGGSVTYLAGPRSRATELAIDGAGRLVAAGTVGTGGVDGDFVVARFLADGTPDSSFGDQGSVRIGFPNFESLGALAITDQNGVVLAGSGSGGTDSGAILLAKLDEAGDPDGSFSGDGKLIFTSYPENSYPGEVGGLAIGDGGSTYVAWGALSQPESGVHVLKLDAAGDPITGYGNQGVASAPGELPLRLRVSELDLDAGGSAVISITGCSFLHIYCVGRVRRFTTGGAIDASFGDAGQLAFDGPVAKVIAQPDGHLLLAGFERNNKPTRDDFSVRRLLADGAPDQSFSDDGLVTTDFEFQVDAAVDAAIAPDGRVVVLGSVSFDRAGLARYEVADGPADADADGLTDDADRCPPRYSKHRIGCPPSGRRVTIQSTIRPQGRELLGWVIADQRACAKGERVRILRRRPGPDALVGRTRSLGGQKIGQWEHEWPPGAGPFYAKLPRHIEPEVGRCRRDRSPAIRGHGGAR